MFKTIDDFEREIEEQRAKLARDVQRVPADVDDDLAGIRCDFDLPYSTLPKLQSKRWLTHSRLT